MLKDRGAREKVIHSRFLPPLRQHGHLERPRLVSLIEERLQHPSTLIVAAPSGYGKTSAVSEWASTHPGRVAWITLHKIDNEPVRIGLKISQALQALARGPAGDDLSSLLNVHIADLEPSFAFDQLSDAIAEAAEPLYLVIDDAQRAREWLTEGLLGALLEIGAPPLRIILCGTSHIEMLLNRQVLNTPSQLLRSSDLAFTANEIEHLPAEVKTHHTTEEILRVSQGWPLAIRSLLLTGAAPETDAKNSHSLIREYIKTQILTSVPVDIAELALSTSVCSSMTAEMAASVSGKKNAATLLQRAVQLDFFLDRYQSTLGTVYRWHPVIAEHCLALLDATHPTAKKDAYRAAATQAIAEGTPLQSAEYLLLAGEPEQALQVLLSRWINLLVSPEYPALENLLAGFPAPYDDDPRLLLMRACIQEISGSRESARIMLARAEDRATSTHPLEGYEQTLAFAKLLLADDRTELANASEMLVKQLKSPSVMPAHQRAAAMYLIGFAGIRHRSYPEVTLQMFSNAATEAQAIGATALADRALSNLAWALAWVGQFSKAQAVIDRRTDAGTDEGWVLFAGGSAATAAGFLAYWADDLDLSLAELRKAELSGSSSDMFAGAAKFLSALSAASTRDMQICKQAAKELETIPISDERGLNWVAFRHLALAALHEASGNKESALKVVAHYEFVTDLPLVTVVLANITMRLGQVERAVNMFDRIEPRYAGISYVQVSALAAKALLHRQQGRRELSHEVLQKALHIATAEGIRRPFVSGGLEMRKMLSEHLPLSSPHEAFLSGCLAPKQESGPLSALSQREKAVLTELRTTKTTQEIADSLAVSVNTVKTHQRSIYRKLGVQTRREAIRLA